MYDHLSDEVDIDSMNDNNEENVLTWDDLDGFLPYDLHSCDGSVGRYPSHCVENASFRCGYHQRLGALLTRGSQIAWIAVKG